MLFNRFNFLISNPSDCSTWKILNLIKESIEKYILEYLNDIFFEMSTLAIFSNKVICKFFY